MVTLSGCCSSCVGPFVKTKGTPPGQHWLRGFGSPMPFRVPDRGSGNPTPLGGGGLGHFRVDGEDGSVQAWQPYGLGLQVPLGLGDEVSLSGAWRDAPQALLGSASVGARLLGYKQWQCYR